jgi:hypothetical protein
MAKSMIPKVARLGGQALMVMPGKDQMGDADLE